MIRKPFELSEYNECNNAAINKVTAFLIKRGYSISRSNIVTDNYDVDITINNPIKYNEISYHEVEIKKVWNDIFKWNSIQIPSRKGKYNKPNYYMWVINNTLTQAYMFSATELTLDKLIEVPNKKIASGEYFYQVPIYRCKLINLE